MLIAQMTDIHIGFAPDERPERYQATSPVELLPFDGQQAFFAGRVFAAQVPAYEAAVKRAGDTIHTRVLADAGHFVFIDPLSDVWPAVLKTVRGLLSMPE